MVDREVVRPAAGTENPLSWRVPPYQPALLMLLVCGSAALNIYGHPSQTVRVVTLALGALALGMAVAALRMCLVVDDDGVLVRYLLRPAWLPWSEIARVEVVPDVRGAASIRFVRHDGSYVDVPPSLLQPSRPTAKPRALAQLNSIGNQLEARRIRRA
ncbi:MAG: hypothetical protein QOE23_2333 [Pseudonocardiales bacterium]|jgi:hypothetical protein|nr:hypothetical protein [Pseudonocardiales bacterium]